MNLKSTGGNYICKIPPFYLHMKLKINLLVFYSYIISHVSPAREWTSFRSIYF